MSDRAVLKLSDNGSDRFLTIHEDAASFRIRKLAAARENRTHILVRARNRQGRIALRPISLETIKAVNALP